MSKKKANGEGSITKRADGRYMARYTVNGKRKTIYGATHSEVREKLNEKLTEIARGEYFEPTKMTVEKWMKTWLVTYALPSVKQSTYVSYEGYVRLHINPAWGNILLVALTTEQLQKFFNDLRKSTPKRKKHYQPNRSGISIICSIPLWIRRQSNIRLFAIRCLELNCQRLSKWKFRY